MGSAHRCGKISRYDARAELSTRFADKLLFLPVNHQKKYCNVFISPSYVHNARSGNYKKLIETVSPNRLLIESDYYAMSELTPQTIKILNTVSEIRGWPIEQEWVDSIPEGEWGAVRRLEMNWKAFLKGGHRPGQRAPSKLKRFRNDWASDDEVDEA